MCNHVLELYEPLMLGELRIEGETNPSMSGSRAVQPPSTRREQHQHGEPSVECNARIEKI